MVFVPGFGKLLHFPQDIAVYGAESVLARSDLPELQFLHLFHHPLYEGVSIFFVHCAKPLSDPFSAIMELPLDCPHGNPHPIRYLRHRQPLKVMQFNDLPHFLRQAPHPVAQLVPLFLQKI